MVCLLFPRPPTRPQLSDLLESERWSLQCDDFLMTMHDSDVPVPCKRYMPRMTISIMLTAILGLQVWFEGRSSRSSSSCPTEGYRLSHPLTSWIR